MFRKVEREGALKVKFKSKCVTIKQKKPLKKEKSTSKMKQDLSFFRKCWSGFVEARGLRVRAPPPKTTAPFYEGLPREAPLVKKRLPVKYHQ